MLGPLSDAATEGVSELPGPEVYQLGGTAALSPEGRYGSFAVVEGAGASYALRYAAGLLAAQGTRLADLEQAGPVFTDGRHVVAQWLNGKGGLWTVVMTTVGDLPMADPVLAPVLASMWDFTEAATSVEYTVSYERRWEDTTRQNRSTGVVTTGDQGESWTATVSSDLTSSGSFMTSSWELTTDGVSDGALSHVEFRWTPGAEFFRAGCRDADLEGSAWMRVPWDGDAFANLTAPGYVPALLERLIDPRLVEGAGADGEGSVVVGFSLRRPGLSGLPWPLWSYGEEWDTEVDVELGSAGELLGMSVVSSREANATGGPGSDVVGIEFDRWNVPVEVEIPTDVVDRAPWPESCPVSD